MFDIKTIKKDQIFYECQGGHNMRFTALEDSHRDMDDLSYWTFKAVRLRPFILAKNQEIINFGGREGYEAYHSRLYDKPEYINRNWKAHID